MPVWLGRQLGLSHTGAIVLTQVSEIEFRTLYVVAERWIVARTLRFMHETNVHSDTLSVCPGFTSSVHETCPRCARVS